MTYSPVVRGARFVPEEPSVYAELRSDQQRGGLCAAFRHSPEDAGSAADLEQRIDAGGSGAAARPDYKVTRAKQFNLVARERAVRRALLSVAYIGLRGDRINQNQNINMPSIAAGNVQQRRPYFAQYPQLTNINMISQPRRAELQRDADGVPAAAMPAVSPSTRTTRWRKGRRWR